MTTNMTRASPEASRSSLGRVMETINLSLEARQARREAFTVTPIIPPPLVPEQGTESRSDRESLSIEPDPPVMFEGMDDVCAAMKDSSMDSMFVGSHAATCSIQHAGRERSTITTHRP